MWTRTKEGKKNADGSLAKGQQDVYENNNKSLSISSIRVYRFEGAHFNISIVAKDIDTAKELITRVMNKDATLSLITRGDSSLYGLLAHGKNISLDSEEKEQLLNFMKTVSSLASLDDKTYKGIISSIKTPELDETYFSELLGENFFNTTNEKEKEKIFVEALAEAKNYHFEKRNVALMSLGDALFAGEEYAKAFDTYELVSKTDKDLYERARYQMGSIMFTQQDAIEFESPQVHAQTAMEYLLEAGDYKDASLLRQRLFDAFCNHSYKLEEQWPLPKGANDVKSLAELGDAIHKKVEVSETKIKTLEDENKRLREEIAKLKLAAEETKEEKTDSLKHGPNPKLFK